MKSVSIAMATYNGARFIGEQLDSLARQTLLPAELVVTDDNSTDNTVEIISRFAATAPFPVRVERNQERLGHRGNFMKAIELCESELIAFCDQDDVWMPEKLESCVCMFETQGVLLVYHNAITATEKLVPMGLMDYSAAPQVMNPPLSLEAWKNAAWGFTTVIDRYLLNFTDLWSTSVDLYETHEKDKHDQWFFFLASCLGTTGYVKKSLALYRQHSRNTIGYHAATTFLGKISILFVNEMDGIKRRAVSAGARARILEEMNDRLDDPYREPTKKAAAGYRKMESAYRQRLAMYSSGNVFSRFRYLIRLSRFGGYRSRIEWGVGRQALLRDIIRGVIFTSESPEILTSKSS